MAFKHNNTKSLSIVFVAMSAALVLLSGEAHCRSISRRRPAPVTSGGGDPCRKADNPTLCRAVTKGQKSAFSATQVLLKQLQSETAAARSAAAKLRKKYPEVIEVCGENYDDALSSVKECFADMAKRDKGSFNSFLSAVITDLVTCEDTFQEMGVKSPLAKTNSRLRSIASTGLYLSTLLWR